MKATPLAAAEDSLARLDERLAKSPIRDGWVARTHFVDAAASLWLEGELLHLEDLVLHDADMNVRAPTHDIVRAHAVLRARRRIAAAAPDWALSTAGVVGLRGGAGEEGKVVEDGEDGKVDRKKGAGGEVEDAADARGRDQATTSLMGTDERLADGPDDELAAAFAAVEAALGGAARALTENAAPQAAGRDPLVYDLDWDEDARLGAWRSVVGQTQVLPATLAAAVAADAWATIEPLQRGAWLGPLLAAALLRARGKARVHLPCLNAGLKAVARERRRSRDSGERLAAQLAAIAAAAEAGLKDHDRWQMTRTLLSRKLVGRRSTSRLPALLDYVLTRPLVSAGMIAAELRITPRAAQDLVAELGLREATGRGRYRAWGIL